MPFLCKAKFKTKTVCSFLDRLAIPAGVCWDDFNFALLKEELGLILASELLWKLPNYNGSSDDIILPSAL